MRKTKKIFLILATCFFFLGAGIFAIVMSFNGWKFKKIGGHNYQTNSYTITEDFNCISIDVDTTDIVIRASEDGTCKVVCYETEKVKHIVSVSEGTLIIKTVDERKFYDKLFGADIALTVYLSKTNNQNLFIKASTGDIEVYKDVSFEMAEILLGTGDVAYYANTTESLKVKTSTGDIHVENISAGIVGLTASTGDTVVKSVYCTEFTSEGATGDIMLENVIATEKLSIERDTGDVQLTACDAGEIVIETDTGDVNGTLLSGKTFCAETDTGHIDVPNSSMGGRCQITTDTGDIKIKILEA